MPIKNERVDNALGRLGLISVIQNLYKVKCNVTEKFREELIQYIVSNKDPNIINIVISIYEKELDFDSLFLLAKEMEKQEKDTGYLMCVLCNIVPYNNLSVIDQLLIYSHTDAPGLIEKLLFNRKFSEIKVYLEAAGPMLSYEEVKRICSNIGYAFVCQTSDSQELMNIISVITSKCICFNINFFNNLLYSLRERTLLLFYCVERSGYSSYIDSPVLLFKYSEYLFLSFNNEYYLLEDAIIDSWCAASLNSYALLLNFLLPKSKRRILEKIASFKLPEETAKFINNNLEYKKLLPML